MDHPFGDDDRTLQLGETYGQYYQPLSITDHPSVCPPPFLLPAATAASRWPPLVEGGAGPVGSSPSHPHGHLTAAKDPARRSRGATKRTGGGVKLSTDPQSVAARQRRHRISDRFKILKSLVPGGSKMDTVSMLEEAINYVKFLKAQIWLHQAALMLHPDDQHRPPPPPQLFLPASSAYMPAAASAATSINAAGNYDYASSFSSTCCLVLPNDHEHIYTIMPPDGDQQQLATATNSVAFPCCTFHDEEEMFHHGTLNY